MTPKHKSKRVKEQNRNQLKSGDYALIITPDNDIEFLMPLQNEIETGAAVPKHAYALIAFANRLSDEVWATQFVEEFFSQYNCNQKKTKK